MEAFSRLCAQHHLLPRHGIVLCALSGGADSVALLHLLWETGRQGGFTVAAAHFNHQIRRESGQDAAFCEAFCRERGISCYVGSADIPALAAARGLGLEETARAERYQFLRTTAAAIGAAAIATAHHAEDNAETVLLHLLRGTGLKGMGGIAPKTGDLIRPLLTTHRGEIEAYLTAHHLPHVEDSTNADTAYTRNYIRHNVLPLLTARNPGVVDTIGRSAASFRRDSDYLEQQAADLWRQAAASNERISLPAAVLANAPDALGLRAIQQMAAAISPETVLSAVHREAALALCRNGRSSQSVKLPDHLEAVRVFDDFVLRRAHLSAPPPPRGLPLPGHILWGGWAITSEEAVCPPGKFNRPESFYVRAAGPVTLRSRQPGDEITLPARSRKRIKKLLIDSRIPREARDRLPVFEAEGRVIALGLFGTDQGALPAPGERCWHITMRSAP